MSKETPNKKYVPLDDSFSLLGGFPVRSLERDKRYLFMSEFLRDRVKPLGFDL